MATLRELQRSLAVRTEELKAKDDRIQSLEKDVQQRDATIKSMQVELDKFKQVLKPMTQQLTQNLTIQAMVLDEGKSATTPGRDGNTTVGFSSSMTQTSSSSSSSSTTSSFLGGLRSVGLIKGDSHPSSGSSGGGPFSRMKRFAISAEPSKYSANVNPLKDMVIKKVEKSNQ